MADKLATDPTRQSWLYHPRFPEQWTPGALYSLATWLNGLAFRNIQFSEAGMPIIKIAEIKGGISGQTKFTQQTFDESVRVRPGDMLFSWSGQPETSIDVFWWKGPEGWLNQHVFRVTPESSVDRTFFYYLLRYLRPNFVGIASNKQTTGLGYVTKRDLENMEVAYPEPKEQQAIACILGALDDKIELNRRRNRTLEGLARAIFQSWFVDFEPVKAKAAGDQPPGLKSELAALFPDRFDDSPLGPIPAGWRAGTLGEIATEARDSISPTDIDADMPYIALEHIPKRCLALDSWGTADGVASGKLRFRRGDILFGKLRPYFHKVGPAPIDGVCSTDIVVAQPSHDLWYGVVLGHMASDAFVAHTDRASTGTKMPRTKWRDMAAYEIAVPCDSVASEFTRLTEPMLAKIRAAIMESRTLAALRDTLLPKLLSGEIELPEAEALVEGVT